MTQKNLRMHPDACAPVGSWGHVDPTGAFTLTVPAGASGILIQQSGTGNTWFCISGAVTATNQGFIVPGDKRITKFWFDPDIVTTFYGFNDVNSDFHYQFISYPGSRSSGR